MTSKTSLGSSSLHADLSTILEKPRIFGTTLGDDILGMPCYLYLFRHL